MGLGDVGFAHGTTQALHNGMFLYSEGISAVGQGKSLGDIKKLAKQTCPGRKIRRTQNIDGK
eukprot:11311485-Ditylum_brightwellii.AAC.1